MAGSHLKLDDIENRRVPADEAKRIAGQIRDYLLEEAKEKVGGSAFMRRLEAGEISKPTLQQFWLNWHSQVWDINNLILAAYHSFTPFFKKNLDLLPLFADKVADELIQPRPPGHILVVWRQGEIFGLTREQMVHAEVIPECRALMEWHRGLLHEGTMMEFWAAISYEEYTGYWSRAFGRALIQRYGYKEAPYFRVHEEADLEEHGGVMGHAQFNWMVLCRMLEQGEARFRPGFSIQYTIDTELSLRRNLLNACAEL